MSDRRTVSSSNAIGNFAGQLNNVVLRMRGRDLVVLPKKRSSQVAIEVGTLDDRPIGVPDADQKPEVGGIHLDTPAEIAEAGDRRRFGFVA